MLSFDQSLLSSFSVPFPNFQFPSNFEALAPRVMRTSLWGRCESTDVLECSICEPCNTSSVLIAGEYGVIPGCGFLRLHSTYRHDLKIYASDEGRVQMTAAAFAKVSTARQSSMPQHFHIIYCCFHNKPNFLPQEIPPTFLLFKLFSLCPPVPEFKFYYQLQN